MVLSGEPFSGFGFLRSVSPGAASRRGDSLAAVLPRACVALPTGRGAQSANGGFSRSLLYRVKRAATILSSDRRSSLRGRPFHQVERLR